MNAIASQARESLLERRNAIRKMYQANSQERRRIDDESEADWTDRAAGSEVGIVLDQLSADEQRELVEIQAALERIHSGTYGICERCGGAIGRLRLRALPEAPQCITCSEKAERAD